MIEARFTEQMIEKIEALKGQKLLSFLQPETDGCYLDGTVRIITNEEKLDILNAELNIPWFENETETVYSFQIVNATEKSKKKFVEVNEIIENVEVVTDIVKIPEQNYEIALDTALIFTTKMHKYTFCRGWFFSSAIDYAVDKNADEIYPIKEVAEDWSNGGCWKVDVQRIIK